MSVMHRLPAGQWAPIFAAAAPVTTSNPFAALGVAAAASSISQLEAAAAAAATRGLQFQPPPLPPPATAYATAPGYNWQQQQPFMFNPFFWQPVATAAAVAAAPAGPAREAAPPAAVRAACQQRRGVEELLMEADACMMSRCASLLIQPTFVHRVHSSGFRKQREGNQLHQLVC
jgi:hypothetical protein